MPLQVGGLHGQRLAALQAGHTHELLLLLAGAVVALAVGVVLGLGVGGDDALVVAQDDLLGGLGDDVLRHDRGLAAAARGVHHEGGHAEAGGVAAQAFDDLDALLTGVRKCSRPMDRSH